MKLPTSKLKRIVKAVEGWKRAKDVGLFDPDAAAKKAVVRYQTRDQKEVT